MQATTDTPNRGRSGKARRVHYRNRAMRLQAQQMIDEYYLPDAGGISAERHIPIRGRSEFLPSVAQSEAADLEGSGAGLDLPVAGVTKAAKIGSAGDTKRKVSGEPVEPSTHRAIRFPRSAQHRTRLALKPPEHFRGKSGFTLGGFLLGCAAGSAAAALLLFVVHAVTG